MPRAWARPSIWASSASTGASGRSRACFPRCTLPRGPVEIKGMELVEVRDGKIVVDNLYYDSLVMLVQLGLVPLGATA